MPTLILINPAAGRKKDKSPFHGLIEERFRREGEQFEIIQPDDVGHWSELVRSASDKDFDKLLAVGGDGTVHLSLQGFDYDNVALGILPLGSGNDIYRTFGIPINPGAALDNFFAGEESVDVGEANGRFFLNTAGMGLDSWTLLTREKSSGRLAGNYVYQFIKTLRMLKPLECEINIDGTTINRNAYWVIAANNRFIGGGMKVAPDADIRDGILDIIVIGKIRKVDMLLLIPRIFKGTHINHPKVEVYKGKEITIKCADDIPCAVDGELFGKPPLEIKLHHGKLRLRGRLGNKD